MNSEKYLHRCPNKEMVNKKPCYFIGIYLFVVVFLLDSSQSATRSYPFVDTNQNFNGSELLPIIISTHEI